MSPTRRQGKRRFWFGTSLGLAALLVIFGLIGYGCDAAINGGIWTGQHQLAAFGVPVSNTHFTIESDETGSDLCYSAQCSSVARTYSVGGHQLLNQIADLITERLRTRGYHPDGLQCAAAVDESIRPTVWQVSCFLDGTTGPQDLHAVMDLAGVDLSQYNLPAATYSPYGGLVSKDVAIPIGDPEVTAIELTATG
jgi:hypothetical protein